jgi:hypothetical protein
MLIRSVAGDKVQADFHPTPVRRIEEPHQIGIRPIAGCRLIEIRHIVPRVAKRRDETWVQPERVAAKRLNIIKLANDALDIADAVAICVEKRLRINLVENS